MNMTQTNQQMMDIRVVPWLGVCVRDRRKLLKLSQAALAKRSEVSRSALMLYEKGRKKGGTMEMLEQLCNGLGISCTELVAEASRRALENRERR
jgi:transcriptional regulator with XRE-family HTH domain